MRAMREAGFVRPGYAQLLEEQEARARQMFGEDIDTGEQTALGKFIRLGVYDLARLYEEMEGVYLSRFPHLAKGVGLDRLTPFAGVHRNPASAAVHKVRLEGVAGTLAAQGMLLGTAYGVYFRARQEAVLNESGVAEVQAECLQRGVAGNVASGDICVVVNPQMGLYSAKGLLRLADGKEAEGDAELRERFDLAVQGVGSATVNAVRAAVLRVPGVSSCQVLENDGEESNEQGVPPHSFACFVLAETAADEEVAAAIFSKKPLGIKSCGEVAVPVRDSFGGVHELRFSHVQKRWLAVKGKLVVSALFPKDGVQQVKRALAAQVGSLPAGRGLALTALYPVLYGVPGVEKAEGLQVSLDGGAHWQVENVEAELWQALRLEETAVQLEVTLGA